MEGPPALMRIIAIGDAPDVTITVTEPKRNDNRPPATAKFQVEQAIMVAKSAYFKANLSFNASHGHGNPRLQDDNIVAMHIWFLLMHDVAYEDWDFKRSITITTIWHVINAADKYLIEGELAVAGKDFFDKWYQENVHTWSLDEDFARQLALPCHFFDHVKGFAKCTEWLAYNYAGHISELRPVSFKWKHLHLCPPDFVRPLNHARGSLKTSLHRFIWRDVGLVLKNGERFECRHWDAVVGQYFAALVRTEVYPLEYSFSKHSIYELLNMLDDFVMRRPPLGCDICTWDWKRQIEDAQTKIPTFFQGLCIDCMNKSKAKHGNVDKDYWKGLGNVDGRWDKGCRLTHGETTWYVSWCGRDEHRRQLIDEHRDRKKDLAEAILRV